MSDKISWDTSDGAAVDGSKLDAAVAVLRTAVVGTLTAIRKTGTQTNLVCFAYWQVALACIRNGFPDWAGQSAAFKQAYDGTVESALGKDVTKEELTAFKSAISTRMSGSGESAGYREAMIVTWVLDNPIEAGIPADKQVDPKRVRWSGPQDKGTDPSKGERPQVPINVDDFPAFKAAVKRQYEKAGLEAPVKYGGKRAASKNAKGTQDKAAASPDKLTDTLVGMIHGDAATPALSGLFASKTIRRTLAALVLHLIETAEISEREEISAEMREIEKLADFGARQVLPTHAGSPTAEEIDAVRKSFPVGTTLAGDATGKTAEKPKPKPKPRAAKPKPEAAAAA